MLLELGDKLSINRCGSILTGMVVNTTKTTATLTNGIRVKRDSLNNSYKEIGSVFLNKGWNRDS